LLQDNIRSEKGQLIVATHNPLMVGSLHKSQVRILTKTETGIKALEPTYDPIGIGVEGLLKSELYGLRSTLAPEVLMKVDRHYALLGKPKRTPKEQDEVMRLASELNEMGISRSHPNPYFEQFAQAMAKRRLSTVDEPLSKRDIEEQTKLADDILQEILTEEAAE